MNLLIIFLLKFTNLIFVFVFIFRVSPSEPADQDCHGDEEQQTDPEDSPCDTEGETPLTESEPQSQKDTQVIIHTTVTQHTPAQAQTHTESVSRRLDNKQERNN